MPPHLHRTADGIVVAGRPVSNFASVTRLCQCWECYDQLSIPPLGAGVSPLKGRYLPYNVYKAHQTNLRKSGLAAYYDALAHVSNDPLPAADARLQTPSSTPSPSPSTQEKHESSNPQSEASPNRRQRRSSQKECPPEAAQQILKAKLQSFKLRLPAILKDAETSDYVFASPPSATSPSSIDLEDQGLALDSSATQNEAMLRHEKWLKEAIDFVELNPCRRDSAHTRMLSRTVLQELEQASSSITAAKRLAWLSQRENAVDITPYDCIDTTGYLNTQRKYLGVNPVFLIVFLLTASLNILSGVSLRKTSDVLRSIKSILLEGAGSYKAQFSRMANEIPSDARTVRSAMPYLAPTYKAFATCPSCYATYKFNPKKTHSHKKTGASPEVDTFPEKCTFRAHSDAAECGHRLRPPNRVTPDRTFLYQDFKHWLAWMFCRPDIAAALEQFPLPDSKDPPDVMNDIWDGALLREFKGPESLGDQPFMVKLQEERRLIFSFNFDALNPGRTRPSGKITKVCGMYMACMNLPRPIRLLVENVFLVGIVPGPNSPSTSQINHVLRPLVDDLIDLWENGVYLNKTPLHPLGILVRCALVPVVCDLPAARQVSGFSSHSSEEPCHECKQKLRQMDDLNYHSWQLRDAKEQIKFATDWRDASSQKEQDQCFSRHHMRWSEFLRLPYWNPVEHLVIDSMHCFYLGLIRHHCRNVWGMSTTSKDGDGVTFDPPKKSTKEDQMAVARYLLRVGSVKDLPAATLSQLCREHGLRYSPRLTADVLRSLLLQYRIDQGWFDNTGKCTMALSDQCLYVYYHGSSSVVRRHLSIPLAQELCTQTLHLSEGYVKRASLATLVEAIQSFRKKSGVIDATEHVIQRYANNPTPTAPTCVLGTDALIQYREDLEKTSLPSWVGRSPKRAGDTKHGRLKADEWRSFCTVHLPITLVRLWGANPDSRSYKVLSNFMHLVQAVKIASQRTISTSNIDAYEFHMHSYLVSLLELYPGTVITPYQHISLHFGQHLRRWGPVHSWRCFAFERFNGIIQNLRTNSRFGEIETTIFHAFTRGQRLRALFRSSELPPSAQSLVDQFSTVHGSDIRSTFMQDDLVTEDGPPHLNVTRTESLPEDEFALLQELITRTDDRAACIPNRVCRIPHVRRRGEVYQSLGKTHSNSQVIFKFKGNQYPGLIQSILSHTTTRLDGTRATVTYVLLRKYLALTGDDAKKDAYRAFPAGGALFYETCGDLALVKFSDIICQFALTRIVVSGIKKPCIHVLPLIH